jgi:PAS domain S-box-containing protein
MTSPLPAPTEDLLNLLHALPHPIGLFQAEDGSVIAVNEPFCDLLKLSEEERTRILRNEFGSDGPNPLRLNVLDESIAHFIAPSGIRSLIDTHIKTVRLGGQECRLVMAAAVNWPGTPEQKEIETGRYRALLENLNEIIYVDDEKANVAYVSPNIFRLTGYEAHEVIGKSFMDFVHPEDLVGRMDVFLKILSGEEQATEYRMRTKSGEYKWVRTNARPIMREGALVGIQGALVDVTDLKEAEEALKLSEEKYRNVVQNSKDAIFVTQDHKLKFMNPRASAILGDTCENVADQPFLDFVHPDDRMMVVDRYNRRLDGESLPDGVSFRILDKAGHVKDVELNSVLIAWQGRPAALAFLRDVTVQKKMESQLRNAQKVEALGTLSGGIAHNFNNLLMGIQGHVSLAMADIAPSTMAYKNMEKIVGLVQSGSKLTRQLLQYARDGAREMVTVDINQLVRDASETLGATKKQIRIRFQLSREVPRIKADQGQIEQVLLNLLLNAADAMPEGGDLRIETACLNGGQAEGKVTLSRSMDYVMLKVSDTGTGIPEDVIHRIFEPFFTTKGLGRGTGLGLSTVYGIVKNHDGDICVESQVGGGSTFLVYLPARAADNVCPAAAPAARVLPCQGRILIVDDEPNVLRPVAALLAHSGFTVFEAISGLDAIEIFQQQWKNIDLVVLDLILPGMSGKDIYYRLREISPQVKVLISSGCAQDGQADELMAGGCLGFIQKPYNIEALSTRIMEIFRAG